MPIYLHVVPSPGRHNSSRSSSAPLYKVVVIPGRESNSRSTCTETDAITTRQRAGLLDKIMLQSLTFTKSREQIFHLFQPIHCSLIPVGSGLLDIFVELLCVVLRISARAYARGVGLGLKPPLSLIFCKKLYYKRMYNT